MSFGLGVGEHEAHGVPELGDEGAAHLGPLAGVREVLGRGLVEEAEAHGVGAVLVEQVQGVYGIALRPAHLRPVFGEHDGVNVHLLEWDLVLEMEAHHYHAGHPEVHDLTRRREQVGRVEVPQVLRVFVGPPEGGDRPQAAGEPGVEHVGILLETLTRRLFGRHDLPVRTVPHRYALPPPELPGDVPVADVLQPPDRLPAPGVGVDGYLILLQGLDGWFGERPHRTPPLLREPRLDDRPAPLAMPDPEGVRSNTAEETQAVELLHDPLAGFLAAHSIEWTTGLVDRAVGVHDVDGVETKPLAYLEVVGVVGGGDLEDPGTEFGIYVLVGEDLYLPLDEWHHDPAADEVFVPDIARVDDERDVAEHRLRARREDLGVLFTLGAGALAVDEGVADAVELALHVLVVDLEVRDGRAVVRAPVGDAVAAVNQTLVVQPDKGRQDRIDVVVVHGVAEPAPVE